MLSIRNNFFSSALIALFEKFYRLIILTILMHKLSNYLGPEIIGLFSYGVAISSIIIVAANFIPEATLFSAYQNLNATEAISITNEVISFRLAINTFLYLILFLTYTSTKQFNGALIIIFILIVLQSFDTIQSYFQYHKIIHFLSIYKIISLTLFFIANLLVIYLKLDYIFLASLIPFEILTFYLLIFSKYNFKFNYSLVRIKNLIHDSLPYYFSALIIILLVNIDIVLLDYLSTPLEVGYYSAPVKLTSVFYLLPTTLATITAPYFFQFHRESPKKYYQYAKYLFYFYLVISCCSIIVVLIFGDYIILNIFGKEFINSIYIFKILIFSTFPVYIGSIISTLLLTHNLRMHLFYASLFGLFFNIILNMILIPNNGAIGAAYSTVISYSISSLIYLLCPQASRKIILNIFTAKN